MKISTLLVSLSLLLSASSFPDQNNDLRPTLRVCDDVVDTSTLDPRKQFSEKNYTIIHQIFDGLVRFDQDGRIEPSLAKSWRQIDPMTIEFELRPDVRFHNGENFDAEAVKFSLESFIDPKIGFPGAKFLSSLERVDILNPLRLRVHTKYPDGILLNSFAALVSILPPKYIKQMGSDAFARNPIGTGPFRFSKWEHGKKIVFDSNDEYWGGPPKFKQLTFLFLPTIEQVNALLNGDVDIVTELPGTDTLRVMQSKVASIVKKEAFYTVGSSVNTSTGPMSDRRVRQAINYAINKDMLIRYDVLGNGLPLPSLTMPGQSGHDPLLKPYRFDPRKSRQLLKEAGFAKGLKLHVVVKVQGERTMKIIASQLKEVGIELLMTPTTDATVIQDIQKKIWDFTFGGCPNPLAHAFFIQFIFLSNQSPYSITNDPKFELLLNKMVATLDPKQQDEVGRELDRYVHDEALGVFTYQRIKTYGVSKSVHFVPSVTAMHDFFRSSPLIATTTER